jgi:exopolysaccharide production protein ExoQ
MPPPLAASLTIAFIVFLFRRDIREKPNISTALWLPLIWLFISCSRGFSAWLNILGLEVSGASSVEEGSPLDACFYFLLIAVGFYVLSKRQIRLSEIAQQNGWLIVFVLYCFVSIIWSDFPFVAVKRWIKFLGHPTMALIVLTEADPKEAVIRLMKRCAYVVAPVSILFIKYFPQLGRSYEQWSGLTINNGIAAGKNLLGADCLVLGFSLFWYLLQVRRTKKSRWKRHEFWLIAGFLAGIAWLLRQAHSATSLTTLLVAVLVVVFVGTRWLNKKWIGTYMLAAIIVLVVGETVFDLSARFSEALGRNSTLSGRTGLWTELLKLDTNPIVGTGFESFWLGDRLKRLAELYWWKPNEAHNGYLEIYLTLGVIGLLIVAALLLATFGKIRLALIRDFNWGRYRLGFFAAILLYNWTEAAFKSFHPVGFAFYLIAIGYGRGKLQYDQKSIIAESSRVGTEPELVNTL